MSNYYVPRKDTEMLSPFGPTMGYHKMPDDLVSYLNRKMDSCAEDYSDQLVGKVKEELKFTDEVSEHLQKELSPFIARYQQYTEQRNSFGTKALDPEKYQYGVQIVSGWFVRQYETEYNPLHIHTGSRLSCVGYLKLPEGIEEEWEEDYKDHHPAHGHIQFAYGTSAGYTNTNFMIKPQVGDFYIFPSQLFHCVYPFYTKGERRSFSMNLNFLEIILEEENK